MSALSSPFGRGLVEAVVGAVYSGCNMRAIGWRCLTMESKAVVHIVGFGLRAWNGRCGLGRGPLQLERRDASYGFYVGDVDDN